MSAETETKRCEAGRRWRCPPRRAVCELPAGHAGEHMSGIDTWPASTRELHDKSCPWCASESDPS